MKHEICLEVVASAMNDMIKLVVLFELLVVVSIHINFHLVIYEKVISINLSFPHKIW